jgi:acyl-CoA synthetase (AMP-forming)/AMP-acid ligase II
MVDRLADRLRAIGAVETPVASVALNDPLAVCLYLAVARAGGTSVPINPRLLAGEKEFILRDAAAGTLVVDEAFADEARTLAERLPALRRVLLVAADGAPPDGLATLGELIAAGRPGEVDAGVDEEAIATVMYTSGTTGHPKGAMRSHRSNLWNVMSSSLGMARREEDVELFNLPIFGIGFLQHVLPLFMAGGTVVLDRAFDPARAWQLLAEHRVTRTFLAPTMIDSLLAVEGHERFDVSPLHTIGVAYEFSQRLRARALARFGDRFVNMYGLTEAQLFCSRLGEFAGRPTSTGKPMGLMRVRIVDEEHRELARGEVGEIALQGPSLMSGYLGRPEDTAAALADGWLYTGDLGRLDEQGDLHFAGRTKEIVKSGGFNVDPVEVENVLLELEGIRDAAVVGAPDERWGEAVVAFLVADGEGASEADVIAHCRERLAGFKLPKRVVFLPQLPRNATGKVERGRLRRRAAGG